MLTGALLGLLVAIGLGESKAQGAALGAAAGFVVGKVYAMTPAGQRAAAAEQGRIEAMRARMDQLRSQLAQ